MKPQRLISRRTILKTVPALFLPSIKIDQYGGTIEYKCDIGESAYGAWYIATASTVWIDFHYYHYGVITVDRDVRQTEKVANIVMWFDNDGYMQLQRVVWSSIAPGFFIGGSCV